MYMIHVLKVWNKYTGFSPKTSLIILWAPFLGLPMSKKELLEFFASYMSRGFQNTPYFNQSHIFSTFGGCPKFRKFQNFKTWTKKNTVKIKCLNIPKLWTDTKCEKIIVLAKVRGVLKTSWQWLLKGIKQKNSNKIFCLCDQGLKVISFQHFGQRDPGLP